MKIFVSVGTVYPMDRLVSTAEEYMALQPNPHSCIAQIGASKLAPKNLQAQASFSNEDFRHQFLVADVILSHAGIGNLVLAEEMNKPIIVMCRQAELGEHVDNHQIETMDGFKGRHFIYLIKDRLELPAALEWAEMWKPKKEKIKDRTQLVDSIKQFLDKVI